MSLLTMTIAPIGSLDDDAMVRAFGVIGLVWLLGLKWALLAQAIEDSR